MRKILLTGNIVKDAESKYINEGNVILFVLCANDRYTDKNGIKQEKAYYYDCSIWRDDTSIINSFKKGVKILVEGAPEIKMWTDKNGNPRANIRVRVSMYEFQNSSKEHQERRDSISLDNNEEFENQTE